jgi:hypothetical protein
MVHRIQITLLSRVKVPLSQTTLHNYLLGIHHGCTLWFQGKMTIKPSANVSPIVSHLIIILQILSQMWITMKENLSLVLPCDPKNLSLLVALRANHLPINTSSIGGMRHPICQPWKQLSQIKMVAIPKDYPHNIHRRPTRTTT